VYWVNIVAAGHSQTGWLALPDQGHPPGFVHTSAVQLVQVHAGRYRPPRIILSVPVDAVRPGALLPVHQRFHPLAGDVVNRQVYDPRLR
jgi:hypothetical protein